MQIIGLDASARAKRELFFKLVFGNSEGYVCLAFMASVNKKNFREEFYSYPSQLDAMLDAIEKNVSGNNVYFCPQLLSEKKRSKEAVVVTPNLWSDLDTCDPDNLLVEPTVAVESSPGRFQGYWKLDKPIDPDDAEDLSRRIAYRHAEEGADRSGWDLTQLLRVPLTYNYKYGTATSVPVVSVIKANRNLYRPSDFDEYPESPDYVKTEIPMPLPADLPPVAEDLLQARRQELNPMVWRLFTQEPLEKQWSQALWNLEMLLYEAGFAREEVYVICRDSKCNKFARDGKPAELLWKDVCRAEIKAMQHSKMLTPPERPFIPLMSEEEVAEVEASPDTFIERYIEWASSLGDAAPQYHQAGAFVALSSLLAGSVRLPTSYGTIIPNLWFMILGDTTLTRKTTAMDICIDLVMEIDEDVVMATDGSLEGLFTTLGARPGRPSIFLRDEFSGLLEAMTKKDYMAGTAEMLTKLYDGKMQKRVLRKEIVEVRDPRLIMFCGGIKNKVLGLLNYEHVASGFMPRFIFITAVSDITRLRPIGPPVAQTTGNKEAIIAELQDVYKHYGRTQVLHIEKLKQSIEQKVTTEAHLTPEAWIRYNELEETLLEIGLQSDQADIMTPVGDRLAKSILKAAVLLAAARQRGDEVEVTKVDILRAIYYGQQWRVHGEDVMANVGKGEVERKYDAILRTITKRPQGCARSLIMQHHHLTARDADAIFSTLEQRGLVIRQKAGRTELLLATKDMK